MNIKHLKPNKNGWTKQGYIDPSSCKKLFEGLGTSPIIFRSQWERKFIYYCENNHDIVRWGSECIEIPYTLLTDGTTHKYNPDFVVEKSDGTTYVIEIKPKNQCVRPSREDGWLWDQYKKNMSKWVAAKQYCESRGLVFKILTEETISRL